MQSKLLDVVDFYNKEYSCHVLLKEGFHATHLFFLVYSKLLRVVDFLNKEYSCHVLGSWIEERGNIVCTRNCYAKLAHRTRNRINEA